MARGKKGESNNSQVANPASKSQLKETAGNNEERVDTTMKEPGDVEIPTGGTTSGRTRGQKKDSPLVTLLKNLLSQLSEMDTENYFKNPVTGKEAPDYSEIIKEPMDFSTMGKKLEEGKYNTVPSFVKDFHKICENSIVYNETNTPFYDAAKKLLEEGNKILSLESVRNMIQKDPTNLSLTDKDLGNQTVKSLEDLETEASSNKIEDSDKADSVLKVTENVTGEGEGKGEKDNKADSVPKVTENATGKIETESVNTTKGTTKGKGEKGKDSVADSVPKNATGKNVPKNTTGKNKTSTAAKLTASGSKRKARNVERGSSSSAPAAKVPRRRLDSGDNFDAASGDDFDVAFGDRGWPSGNADLREIVEEDNFDARILYDVNSLKVMISDDEEESVSLEQNLLDSCIDMKPSIEELADGFLLRWLQWRQNATGVDSLMDVANLLSATALFMNGSEVVVHKDNGHVSPVNIWNYFAALKGSRKTASLETVLKAVRAVEKDLAEEEEDDEMIGPVEITPMKNVSEASSPTKSVKPKTRLLQGGTVEGLFQTMYKADKAQVLLAYDELSNYFDICINKDGKLTPFGINLLSMYSSTDTRDVTSGKGVRIIEKPFISITGGIQPKVLVDTMAKDPEDPASFIDRTLGMSLLEKE